jgi:hypothetical protein
MPAFLIIFTDRTAHLLRCFFCPNQASLQSSQVFNIHHADSLLLRSGGCAHRVYKFAVAAVLNGVLTLNGEGQENPVWTFQIGSAMYFGPSSEVRFLGTGNADHVTWQVGSSATIMGRAKVIGNVLAYASITASGDARVEGRLLARSAAVTVVSDDIIKP